MSIKTYNSTRANASNIDYGIEVVYNILEHRFILTQIMKLVSLLQEINNFVFYSQDGNMGDLLIGEGTRQLFQRLGKHYFTYGEDKLPEKYVMVHSGGARFTSNWCKIDQAIEELCNERVEKCIILPHSFYNVDRLLAHFDERHIIFCRDKYSYEYCKKQCQKSPVYLSDDMAFYLRLTDVRPVPIQHATKMCIRQDECRTLEAIKKGLFETMHRRVRNATVRTTIGGETKSIAFLLRTDTEKGVALSCPLAYDIPVAWHTTGSNMMFNGNILRQFSHSLKQADIIISDRLHVCIMAYLSGCEVYMLDNNYKKLSGVYEQTLSQESKVHLLPGAILTPELEKAWRKLLKRYTVTYSIKNAIKKAKIFTPLIMWRHHLLTLLRLR